MLTVLVPPEFNDSGLDPRYFFDINGDDYRLVTDDTAGAVDILIGPGWIDREARASQLRARYRHRIMLDLDIWHGFEDQVATLVRTGYHGNEYVLTVAEHDAAVDHTNVIKYPFCFNRTRAYYRQFPWSPGWMPCYWSQGSFMAPVLTDASQRKKIFVAPCRTHFPMAPERRPQARALLAELIRKKYLSLGYLGNVTPEHINDWLYPQAEFPDMHDQDHAFLDYRHQHKPPLQRSDWHGYSPPHNAYYTNTFISIYGETIEWGTSMIISEKTWDPLVKGHFILPFSCCGFVDYLQTWGIRLPDFIDYSYDSIQDDQHRRQAWLAEVERLMCIPLDSWREQWDRHLRTVIYHNQRVVNDTEYSKVDLKRLLV